MIFDSLLGMFSVDMGIDLGTCNTLVCIKGEGIVLNEPSVVAVQARGQTRVLQNGNAVGLVAKEMLGKTPGTISAIRPLKDGVISDFDITEAMLRYFIRRAQGKKPDVPFMRPRVVIAIPSAASPPLKNAPCWRAPNAPVPGGFFWSKNRWPPPSARGCRSPNPPPA